ncbi:MAG: hypothetical protein HON90_01535 [Halobacteriovoraceae bacterium]|nr:hypothetical protein [Halobacteriovoraceae bacterium]
MSRVNSNRLAEGTQVTKQIIAPGRNSPCPCGSGKKSKRCCFN